jgi:hypothetical protein
MGILLAILVVLVWAVRDAYWASMVLVAGCSLVYIQLVLDPHQATANIIIGVYAGLIVWQLTRWFTK